MSKKTTQLIRYGLNGLLATLVHYCVLVFNMQVLVFSSSGLANLVAALFGVSASFLGNRYFVFQDHFGTLLSQLMRFSGLYGFIALVHCSVLILWTDWLAHSYHIGFIIASLLQFVLSYFGNKFLVFRV
jgi:putative flippase GtrA